MSLSQVDGCSGCVQLTRRQQEALSHVAAGEASELAAERMGIKPKTLKAHLRHVRVKLQVNTLLQMLGRATRMGLIPYRP